MKIEKNTLISGTKIKLVPEEMEKGFSSQTIYIIPSHSNCKLFTGENITTLCEVNDEHKRKVYNKIKEITEGTPLFLHLSSNTADEVLEEFELYGFIVLYALRVPTSTDSDYQVHAMVIDQDSFLIQNDEEDWYDDDSPYTLSFAEYPVKILKAFEG